MRSLAIAIVIGLVLSLAGCAGGESRPSPSASESQPVSQQPDATASAQQPDAANATRESGEGSVEMKLNIGGADVAVAWEENQAVADLMGLAAKGPVTVALHRYGGFEQVGPLGASLTASDVQMTTEPGDIVLYAGNQISIFYGPNTWAYTRLGHITDRTASEMADLLDKGDVNITISVTR